MSPEIEFTATFEKLLKKKEAKLAASILECVDRLGRGEHTPGMRVKKMQGHVGIWEASVDYKNRLTFEYLDDEAIMLRVNCNHDILKKP